MAYDLRSGLANGLKPGKKSARLKMGAGNIS